MAYITKDNASYKKTTFALFAGSFVTFAVMYSIQPLIPTFSDQFHVSAATASIALSVSATMLAISMLVTSMLSDLIGRRPMMVTSLFMTSVLAILTAVSPNFPFLLIVRALLGISIAGFPGIAMAFINEEFHPKTIGTVMGIYVSGATFGGLSSRVVVDILTDWFSWHISLVVVGIICILISIWFWRNLPDANQFTPQSAKIKRILSAFGHHMINPALLCLFAVAFVLRGSFDTLYNYIGYPLMAPPYNLSQTFVGLIFLVYLAGTFSSALMGKLADRIGKSKTMITSIIIMLAGALLTLHGLLWVKLVAATMYTGGFFGSHAVASGWVGQSANHDKSLASSQYLLFYYLGTSIIGPLGGVFWSASGWSGVIGMITVFVIISLVAAGILSAIRVKQQAYAAKENKA